MLPPTFRRAVAHWTLVSRDRIHPATPPPSQVWRTPSICRRSAAGPNSRCGHSRLCLPPARFLDVPDSAAGVALEEHAVSDATGDPDMFRGDMALWTGRVGLARAAPAVEDQRSDHRLSVRIPGFLAHMLRYRNEAIRRYELGALRRCANPGTSGQQCGSQLTCWR